MKFVHVTRLEDGSRAAGERSLEALPVAQTEDADHELVLAVEGEVELGVPAPFELGGRAEALGESKDSLIGGISVDLALGKGQSLRGGVKFTGVAETSSRCAAARWRTSGSGKHSESRMLEHRALLLPTGSGDRRSSLRPPSYSVAGVRSRAMGRGIRNLSCLPR